jgi:hypothetical protein
MKYYARVRHETVIFFKRKQGQCTASLGALFATLRYLPHVRRASLGVFAQQLRTATINVLYSPSVHVEHLGFYWTDFREISYLKCFKKICWHTPILVKLAQNLWALYMSSIRLWVSRSEPSLQLRMCFP